MILELWHWILLSLWSWNYSEKLFERLKRLKAVVFIYYHLKLWNNFNVSSRFNDQRIDQWRRFDKDIRWTSNVARGDYKSHWKKASSTGRWVTEICIDWMIFVNVSVELPSSFIKGIRHLFILKLLVDWKFGSYNDYDFKNYDNTHFLDSYVSNLWFQVFMHIKRTYFKNVFK